MKRKNPAEGPGKPKRQREVTPGTRETEGFMSEKAIFELQMARGLYMGGSRIEILRAAVVALAEIGYGDLAGELLDIYERWKGGKVLCLGEAFGIPHRRKPPAAQFQIVRYKGVRCTRGDAIFHQVVKLRRAGTTREVAFEKVAECHKLSDSKVQKIYDATRKLLREGLRRDPEKL